MITFMEFLQGMETQSAVSNFLSSDAGKRVAHMDCKTVTRAFINWAGQNGIKARVLLLVPPSPEMIKKHPEMGGKGGQGDAHIMPVVNNDAIDFTARQFGFPNTFENPLITPIQGLKATYQPKGYFTDSPDWNNGKPFYIGPSLSDNKLNQLKTLDYSNIYAIFASKLRISIHSASCQLYILRH